MAKDVKKKLKRDDFDLDNELDLDDFGMSDISGEFSDESQAPKSRNPVTEVFKGTISGAMDQVAKPEFLVKTLEDVLPKSYGTTFSTADKIIDKTSSLYDETIRELKPQLNSLGRKIDRLVPQEDGFLRRMTDKFIEATGGKDQIFNSGQEGQLEQNIQSTIAGVFAANQEAQNQVTARENVKDQLQQGIEKKRFSTEIGVLSGIHNNIARLTSYNDTITQAYQKKSLELQLRSYFAQKELVDFTRKYQEVTTKQFENIAKNTGLPEFVKMQESEFFKEELKRKAYGRMSDKLFGDDSYVDRFFKNLKPYVGERVAQFSAGIEAGMSGLELAELTIESNKSMGGSTWGLIGEMMGAGAVNKVRDLVTPEFRKEFEKIFPDLKMNGEKWASFIANPQDLVEQLKGTEGFKNGIQSDKMGTKVLFETLNDLLNMGKMEGSKSSITGKRLYASDIPSAKTNADSKMLHTVTEIIPGYLAMIHRELRLANDPNADNALVIFDKTTNKFKTETALATDVNNQLKDAIKNRSYSYNKSLEEVTGSLLGDDLSPEDKAAFMSFLSNYSMRSDNTSTDAITKDSEFLKLNSDLRVKAAKSLFSKQDDEGNRERFKNRKTFSKDFINLTKATPNVQDVINRYLENGHDEALLNMGVITISEGGGYNLNRTKYEDFIRVTTAAEREASSDVNMKTNIKSYKGRNNKKSLNGIKKTKVFSWKYKQGLGEDSDNPKIGPMAQDVNRNLGEEAAPNGTKIDLVSLNGIAMSAIQELDKKVDSIAESKSPKHDDVATEYLRLISENTLKALDKLDVLGKLTVIGLPNFKMDNGILGALSDAAFGAGRLLKDVVTGTGKFGIKVIGGTASTIAKGVGTTVGGIYDNRDKIDNTIRTVGGLGKDLVTNVGDMAYKGAKRLTGDALSGVGKVLNYVKDIIIDADIYVKGEAIPKIRKALVESGEYYDKASGTVIRKYSDIKGEVVDKYGNIILSNADILKGLVDIKGNSVKSALRNLFKGAKALIGFGANVVGAVASGAWKLTKKAFKGFDIDNMGMGFGNKKATDAIVEIRDILKSWNKKKKKRNGKDEDTAEVTEPANTTGGTESAFRALDALVNDTEEGKKVKGMLGKVGGFFGLGKEDKPTVTDQATEAAKSKGKGTREERLAAIAKRKAERKSIKEQSEIMGPMPFNPGPQRPEKKESRLDALKKTVSSIKDKVTSNTLNKQAEAQPELVGPMPFNPGPQKPKERSFKDLYDTTLDKVKKKSQDIKDEKEAKAAHDKSFQGPMPAKKGLFDRLKDKTRSKIDEIEKSPSIKEQLASIKSSDIKMPGKKDKGNRLERMARISAKRSIKANKKDNESGEKERRKGSWLDILDGKKADPNAQTKKSKDPKDPDMTVRYKEGGLLGLVLKGLVGLISGAGSLISGAGTIFKTIGLGTKLLGTGIIKGGAMAIRSLPTLIKAAPLISSVIAAGTLGSTFGAVAAVGATVLGALVSPPALAALVIAGVGAGAYYGIKSLTKNNLDKYQLYRAYQYGFGNTKEHIQHHHKVIELEDLIISKHLLVSGGEPRIANSLEWDAIASIFGVSKGDKEQTSKLESWFKNRFKFFFINHLRVLLSIDSSVPLNKVHKLKPEQRKRYLELTSFDDGPHDVTTSPVKDVEALSDNRESIKTVVKNLLAETSYEVRTDVAKLTDESGKYKQAPSMEPKPQKDVVPDKAKPTKPVDTPVLGSEEGKEQSKGGGASGIASAVGGVASPALANGAMRDGSSGLNFIKLKNGVNIDNLHPEMRKNLLAMAQEYGELTGKSITVNEAFRTYAQQAEIHRRSPGTSAPPGKSLHEFGLAMDIDRGILGELDKMGLMKKYGFTRPVGSEPWHAEPAGIQLDLSGSKQDVGKASKLIEYGVGRGGAGFGSIMQGGNKGRNYDMAKALLAMSSSPTVNNQLTQDEVGIAAKAMTDKPKTADGKLTQDDVSMASKATTDRPKPAESKGLSGGYDIMGNSTGGATIAGSEDGKATVKSGSAVSGNLSVDEAIANAASKTGIDQNTLRTFAMIESSMNPNAKNPNSSATGLFQFTKDTWAEQLRLHGKKHNLPSNASPLDPVASSLLAAEYLKAGTKAINGVKSDINDADLYLTHFLGHSGASKFLSAHPNVPGSQLFPKQAASNREMFFDGRRPRTLGEIYEIIKTKVSKAGGKVSGSLKPRPDQVFESKAASGASPSSSSGYMPASYTQDVPEKKSVMALQQAPDLQSAAPAVQKTSGVKTPDLNIVSDNLGESLNVQKQMLDVLSKIHGLISGKGKEETSPESSKPSAKPLGSSKSEKMPNPALYLRRT